MNNQEKTVYICGAITNNPGYKKQFKQAEKLLIEKGHIPVNPTTLIPETMNWKNSMKIAIGLLCKCYYIYRCNDIEHSRGGRIEMDLAGLVGIKDITEEILHGSGTDI